MPALLHCVGIATFAATTVITYLGGFSRFTHGRYTPRFYEYQLDRAPDDASTRAVPIMDVTLATLTLPSATRPYALAACAFFQGVGIAVRLRQGKNPAPDMMLCIVAAVASWGSFSAW